MSERIVKRSLLIRRVDFALHATLQFFCEVAFFIFNQKRRMKWQ